MSPDALYQQLAELYTAVQPGPFPPTVTAPLFESLKAAQLFAMQAACRHRPGKPSEQTHAGGRDRVTKCVTCEKTLELEKV